MPRVGGAVLNGAPQDATGNIAPLHAERVPQTTTHTARRSQSSWFSALDRLWRTTAFKLTLVYLTVFALFAACLLGYFAWNTRRLITEQITPTVNAEITGLSEQYNLGGIRRLVLIVDAR